MAREIHFSKAQWDRMVEISEKAYPREGCGLLFGQWINSESCRVESVAQLDNILEERHAARLKQLVEKNAVALPRERMERGGAFEFLIDPQEHYAKVLEAQKNGLDQVGLFHSHPDHPAQPSATDAAQPYLSGWSNIIVAVHGGKLQSARSWFRAREDSAFQEENIVIQ